VSQIVDIAYSDENYSVNAVVFDTFHHHRAQNTTRTNAERVQQFAKGTVGGETGATHSIHQPVFEELGRVSTGHRLGRFADEPNPLLNVVVGNMSGVGGIYFVLSAEIDVRPAPEAQLREHALQKARRDHEARSSNPPRFDGDLHVVLPARRPPVSCEYTPLAGDTLQGLITAVVKSQSRPRHQILDCARYENLAASGKRRNPRHDVNGDTADILADHFALARV
jgi:hypothetical protein